MDRMSKGTAGDGIIYLNDIGETVKLDKKGHPYKVGSDGRIVLQIIAQAKIKGSPYLTESLPRRKKPLRKKRLIKERRKARKMMAQGQARTRRRKSPKERRMMNLRIFHHPLHPGIEDDDDCLGGRSPSSASTLSADLPSNDDYLTEWEEWTAVENGFGPRATCNTRKVMDSLAIAYAMPRESNKCSTEDFTKNLKERHIPCPSMPGVNTVSMLRGKDVFEGPTGLFEQVSRFVYHAAVSRPVSRAEMLKNPKARASTQNEWLGLHNQDGFDFSVIREYFDVKQEALR